MGESPWWLRKLLAWMDRAEEVQPIVQKDQGAETEKSSYASINGGETADVSCVPCASSASRGTVTCPTCQGTGQIPREQEEQLVALIPYGDQRLKPRRTKLYVTITVAVCLLMTCLMMYFLFPRSIAVVPAGLRDSAVSFDNASFAIILNMTNMLNVTNNNFYGVHVAQLAIEVLHKALVIGKNTAMTHLDIPPLESAQILYTVSGRILDNNTYNICTWPRIKVHNVLLHVQGTLTCSYLAHSEQLAFESYQYVDCRGNATLPGGVLIPEVSMAVLKPRRSPVWPPLLSARRQRGGVFAGEGGPTRPLDSGLPALPREKRSSHGGRSSGVGGQE